jgi:hypothetical protein
VATPIVANTIPLPGGVPSDGKGAKQSSVSCARAASEWLAINPDYTHDRVLR